MRAHGARGPAVLGFIALAAFVSVHGAGRTWSDTGAAARAFDRWLERITLPHRALVVLLALITMVYAWRGNACVAGGSDSYGYLSQAQLWLEGVPIVRQPVMAEAPWPNAALSFTPLGYRPVEGRPAIVPTYAAGLPLFLSGVQRIAGYRAIFLTWPIAGAVLVLASYGLGRSLGSPATGLIAAWLMATDITLRAEVTEPMSDVPVAAALAASCYFLFRAAGPAPLRAGFAAAIAVLVRPNLAFTVAALGGCGWRCSRCSAHA